MSLLRSLVLAPLALALASTASAQSFDRAGFQADLIGPSFYNVSGQVTIVDQDTLLIENFTYNGLGFTVYFYLGANNTGGSFAQGLEIGPQLAGTAQNGTTFTIDLPSGMTLDSFGAVSVWCTVAGISFGSGAFQPVAPEVYCSSSVNTIGCTPQIGTFGLPSMTDSMPFMIDGMGVLSQTAGVLAIGTSEASTPFAGNTLCVGGSMRLTTPQFSAGPLGSPSCAGNFGVDFNSLIQSTPSLGITAGSQVFVQYIYRDRQSTNGIGLTNAATFFVAP